MLGGKCEEFPVWGVGVVGVVGAWSAVGASGVRRIPLRVNLDASETAAARESALSDVSGVVR